MKTLLTLALFCVWTPTAFAAEWVFTDGPGASAVAEVCPCGDKCNCRAAEIAELKKRLEAMTQERDDALELLSELATPEEKEVPAPKATSSKTRYAGSTRSSWRYGKNNSGVRQHLANTHGIPLAATAGRSMSELVAIHSDRHNGVSKSTVLARLGYSGGSTKVASAPSGRWVRRKFCGPRGCYYKTVWVPN